MSRFDPVTVKGNLFTDTLTINSHKINNIQIMKAFAIDNPGQSSTNGFPFDVDYTIFLLSYIILCHSEFDLFNNLGCNGLVFGAYSAFR